MLLIYNEKTDPYFNLAMEEYFLKNATEDIFYYGEMSLPLLLVRIKIHYQKLIMTM